MKTLTLHKNGAFFVQIYRLGSTVTGVLWWDIMFSFALSESLSTMYSHSVHPSEVKKSLWNSSTKKVFYNKIDEKLPSPMLSLHQKVTLVASSCTVCVYLNCILVSCMVWLKQLALQIPNVTSNSNFHACWQCWNGIKSCPAFLKILF